MVVVGNWNFMCTTGVEDIEMIGFAQVDQKFNDTDKTTLSWTITQEQPSNIYYVVQLPIFRF